VTSLNIESTLIPETNSELTKLDFSRANWKKFQKILKDKITLNSNLANIPNDRNISNEDCDEHIQSISIIIEEAIKLSVPKIKCKNMIDCYQNKTIERLQSYKSFLITKVNRMQYGTSADRSQLQQTKAILKNVKTLLKQQFQASVNKYWKLRAQSIQKTNSRTMFPRINKLYITKEPMKISKLVLPTNSLHLESAGINLNEHRVENGMVIIDKKINQLNILGCAFEEIHSRDIPSPIETQVNNSVSSLRLNNVQPLVIFSNNIKSDSPNINQHSNFFTTSEDLLLILKKLNNKKSSGLDNIPNIALKNLPFELIKILTIVFNNLLNNQYFPNCWKVSKIIPIKKKNKDPTNPSSYRPINLVSSLGKVFEILISKALNHTVEDKQIVPNSQFGFKKSHSTVHAMNKLVTDIQWNLNAKKPTGACAIDTEKAFDSVWTNGLIYKLKGLDFPPHIINIIDSMLSDRKFVIAMGQTITERIFKMKNGLPQGTITAPTLYNIFTHDILLGIDNALAFADDIIIYSNKSKMKDIQLEIQANLSKIEKYCEKFKLKINYDKCECILFRTPIRKGTNDLRKNWKTFSIRGSDDNLIQTKTSIRYLGIEIDKFLYFNNHINIQLRKAQSAFMALKSLFFSKDLAIDVKVICYQAFIRPILTYACPIWWNISPSYMERLRKFERKCIRACTNLKRSAHSQYEHYVSNKILLDTANIHRIDNFIIKLNRNYFRRAAVITENDLIRGIAYPNYEYIKTTLKSGFIPPEAFIYLDSCGCISDTNNIPIIYHNYRRATDKKINFSPDRLDTNNFRFCTALPERDIKDNDRLNAEKFFWLE